MSSKKTYDPAKYLKEFDLKDIGDGSGFKYSIEKEQKLRFNAANGFQPENSDSSQSKLLGKLQNPRDETYGYKMSD